MVNNHIALYCIKCTIVYWCCTSSSCLYLLTGNFTCVCNNNTLSPQDGETSLFAASISGHQKVVEILLAAGANPDLQKTVRVNALTYRWNIGAQKFGHPVG